VSYTDTSSNSDIAAPADPWASDPPEPWAAEPEVTADETPAEPTPRRRGRPRGSTDSRPRKPATRKASTTRRRTTRPAQGDRRTAERAIVVCGLAPDELELLRAVVAAEDADLAGVILASLEHEVAVSKALDLVVTVAEAEPVVAGAKAVEASTSPGGLGVAWTALGALAPGLGDAPAGMLDAGLAFATVCQSLEGEAIERARRVRDMLAGD